MGDKQRNTFLLDDGNGGQNGGLVERAKMQRHAMICDPILYHNRVEKKKKGVQELLQSSMLLMST